MIQKLEITATRDTPDVIFDAENNVFEIKGQSLPENSSRFFEPIFNWVEEYVKSPNNTTNLVCNLDYFNSSSAKMIYQLFVELENILKASKEVKISWHYDPEDKLIEEKGLEYQSILSIPLEMVEKK